MRRGFAEKDFNKHAIDSGLIIKVFSKASPEVNFAPALTAAFQAKSFSP
jgi:hypothetical protein